jgi:hypothetical protein
MMTKAVGTVFPHSELCDESKAQYGEEQYRWMRPPAGAADLGSKGPKPHLADTFRLSNDPRSEEKLLAVVRLYLNPPEKAIVLCMDERSSIQAGPHPAVPTDDEVLKPVKARV